jgi:hypothetical protein
VRADHHLVRASSERHDDVPAAGARLTTGGCFDREWFDFERNTARAQHSGERLEPLVVVSRGGEFADIVYERVGRDGGWDLSTARTMTRSSECIGESSFQQKQRSPWRHTATLSVAPACDRRATATLKRRATDGRRATATLRRRATDEARHGDAQASRHGRRRRRTHLGSVVGIFAEHGLRGIDASVGDGQRETLIAVVASASVA